MTRFVYDDGGRKAAGYKGRADDCVCRAIAIATHKPYREVYAALRDRNRDYASTRRGRVAERLQERGASPRDGVFREVSRPYLEELGWTWTPTMKIGAGCTVHLRADELPRGRLIVKCSRHLVAVIDGVIHDTFDCSRAGTRCVYGYWRRDRS
jgi:hypothetical protein